MKISDRGKKLEISGLIVLSKFGDANSILSIIENYKILPNGTILCVADGTNEPLAEILYYKIARKKVTVRYWISDTPATKEELKEDFIVKSLGGVANCKYGSHYSELTGYLWTDEELKIGGHDLLNELKSFKDKWIILEIEVHKNG